MLSSTQYPHWMILSGSILVVIGFVGIVIRKNRRHEVPANEPPQEAEAK